MPLIDYAQGNVLDAFKDENLETGPYKNQSHIYKRVPPEQRQNVCAEQYRRTVKSHPSGIEELIDIRPPVGSSRGDPARERLVTSC